MKGKTRKITMSRPNINIKTTAIEAIPVTVGFTSGAKVSGNGQLV